MGYWSKREKEGQLPRFLSEQLPIVVTFTEVEKTKGRKGL